MKALPSGSLVSTGERDGARDHDKRSGIRVNSGGQQLSFGLGAAILTDKVVAEAAFETMASTRPLGEGCWAEGRRRALGGAVGTALPGRAGLVLRAVWEAGDDGPRSGSRGRGFVCVMTPRHAAFSFLFPF